MPSVFICFCHISPYADQNSLMAQDFRFIHFSSKRLCKNWYVMLQKSMMAGVVTNMCEQSCGTVSISVNQIFFW